MRGLGPEQCGAVLDWEGPFRVLALDGLRCEADAMIVSTEDRRSFLRRLAAGLGGAAISVTACRAGGDGDAVGGVGRIGAETVTRPVLLPWSDDVARIAAPSAELPVAYVSMARRQVFVDQAFRDRASWLLDAHISVSTGLWRIPLAGDPSGQPVTPGDELREFEELGIQVWDPSMTPAREDIRIRRGIRVTRTVHFACVPMSGSRVEPERPRWFSAGPWTVDICDGHAADTTREDFVMVGTGSRHLERSCEGLGDPVRYIMWACRQATLDVDP